MRPYLWAIAVLALAAALAASGCTAAPPPANLTPTATPCAVCQANPTPNTLANLTVEEEQLVAFVNEAAAYARSNGQVRALAAFNDPKGPFVKGERYIFAYGMNGTSLAHPFQPELIGTDRSEATDIRGTKYVREGISAARNGSGFQELWYPNPADKNTVELKTCYVVGMGDWFIGSGYYSTTPNVSANIASGTS